MSLLFLAGDGAGDGLSRPVRVVYDRAHGRLSGQIAAMAGGNAERDFEAAVLPHLDAAYNLARWLMRNAEDAVQDAVVRALTYFAGFRGANPRGWFLQIVRNAAYASMKVNQGARLVPLAAGTDDESGFGTLVPELADAGDDLESALMESRTRQNVERLLAALPPELREAIVLRELQELSYKEISQITETPIGTVMSRLWRARRLLSEMAKGEDER